MIKNSVMMDILRIKAINNINVILIKIDNYINDEVNDLNKENDND